MTVHTTKVMETREVFSSNETYDVTSFEGKNTYKMPNVEIRTYVDYDKNIRIVATNPVDMEMKRMYRLYVSKASTYDETDVFMFDTWDDLIGAYSTLKKGTPATIKEDDSLQTWNRAIADDWNKKR